MRLAQTMVDELGKTTMITSQQEVKALTQTVLENITNKATIILDRQAFQQAQTVIADQLTKTVELSPSQVKAFIENGLQDAFKETAKISVKESEALADTVLEGVLAKTQQITPAQLPTLVGTVVESALKPTVRLTSQEATHLAQTLSEDFISTVKLTPQQQMQIAQTIVAPIMDKLPQGSGLTADALKQTVLNQLNQAPTQLLANGAQTMDTRVFQNAAKEAAQAAMEQLRSTQRLNDVRDATTRMFDPADIR